MIDQSGIALQEAIAILRQYLPKYAVLVGQNIGKDVEWLGLKEGVDFQVRCHFPPSISAFLNAVLLCSLSSAEGQTLM